jgi:hypothetical protein
MSKKSAAPRPSEGIITIRGPRPKALTAIWTSPCLTTKVWEAGMRGLDTKYQRESDFTAAARAPTSGFQHMDNVLKSKRLPRPARWT